MTEPVVKWIGMHKIEFYKELDWVCVTAKNKMYTTFGTNSLKDIPSKDQGKLNRIERSLLEAGEFTKEEFDAMVKWIQQEMGVLPKETPVAETA